jgi:PHD/YefM family antitoxin component YafN of YafNO toxin-antitoxin module
MKDDYFTTSYASIQEIEEQFYILSHKDFNSNMEEVSELPILDINPI